ncbi:hypothetical protein SAMN04487895_10356 [Paenibacillus sophorae]|uniref:Uncharacterized protein n=1 Tax=Paenibacillus sophorae TaxID=1333845 RepID=A0A1H8JK80_9BACL|nr:hypothetical protein [Paenibacillus sophorae]QWU13390.1 hypothetical protein KP014_15425 [Paenibacillus sophorae]SEN81129.1 hypothetical protein SAMN04487895_10356 [Paenibacillus sophorae]
MVVKKEKPSNKIKCIKCNNLLTENSDNFYTHKSPFIQTQRFPLCSKCINSYLNEIESVGYLNRVKKILQHLNRPFLADVWGSSGEEWKEYIRMVSSLPQYKNMTYENSTEQQINHIKNEAEKEEVLVSDDDLINKWGNGFKPEEYLAFERKYNFIKKDYPVNKAMHVEALKKYCRYAVKEEFSLSSNNIKDAETWSKLASKAAEDAKINPKQLSKSDLTDGVDSFGELTKAVEKAVDIIPILPRFIERPQDKVDVTLWCYINYVRDLESLPPVSYKEIYEFYEQRKRDYEDQIIHNFEEGDILE